MFYQRESDCAFSHAKRDVHTEGKSAVLLYILYALMHAYRMRYIAMQSHTHSSYSIYHVRRVWPWPAGLPI